jgi:exonuclease SbcC
MELSGAVERHRAAEAALKKAQQEYDKARERYKEFETEREKLSIESEAAAQAGVAALTELRKQLAVQENEIRAARDLEAAAKRELNQAVSRIAEYKQRKKELEELAKQEHVHDVASKEMRNLRMILNTELRPELEARASENLDLLTNSRYGRLSLDETFSPKLIEDDNTNKPVISGGEEDIVALSLRLALSELIQERQGRPMSLLILDEVFGSLDVDRRQAVLERLAALKGRFQQIFVISHIEEINQVADQCLYVRRSEVTRGSVVTDVPPEGFQLI